MRSTDVDRIERSGTELLESFSRYAEQGYGGWKASQVGDYLDLFRDTPIPKLNEALKLLHSISIRQ